MRKSRRCSANNRKETLKGNERMEMVREKNIRLLLKRIRKKWYSVKGTRMSTLGRIKNPKRMQKGKNTQMVKVKLSYQTNTKQKRD